MEQEYEYVVRESWVLTIVTVGADWVTQRSGRRRVADVVDWAVVVAVRAREMSVVLDSMVGGVWRFGG
jgi:hypothetical protein